jgi:hypothetical protein
MTPKKRKGLPAELSQHPPAEIDKRSGAIADLLGHVAEFGTLALGLRVHVKDGDRLRRAELRQYRVEDVFTYMQGRSGKRQQKASFARTGPKNAEVVRFKLL